MIDQDYKEPLADGAPGESHIIEFSGGPLGRVKLVWTEKAKLAEIKTIYSNRIGSDVKMDKVYNEKEKVSYMNAFRWDEAKGDWEEMESGMFDD